MNFAISLSNLKGPLHPFFFQNVFLSFVNTHTVIKKNKQTIIWNKFLQIKSVDVFTIVAKLLWLVRPRYDTRFSYPKVTTSLRK